MRDPGLLGEFPQSMTTKMVHSKANAPYELCFIGNLTLQRSPTMSFQAYLDNIEEKTGKTPNDFIAMAKVKSFDNPKTMAAEIVAWLKEDYGLGRGHAMAIVYVIKNGAEIGDKHVGADGAHRDESNVLRLDGKKKE
jgi:hypothetical protein